MKRTSGNNRAAMAYQILGQYLPDEVFRHLTDDEIERLLLKVEANKTPTQKEEKDILISFTDFLRKKTKPLLATGKSTTAAESLPSPKNPPTPLVSPEWMSVLEDLLREETKEPEKPTWSQVHGYSQEELRLLATEESPTVVARLLSFANPELASEVLGEYPESLQEQVLLALAEIDYHSDRERDLLERFLRFKWELLEKKLPLSKIKSRRAKTAGELLTRLPFSPSQNLIDRIQKKSPEYAETIVEHYFRLEDLLFLGRSSLTRFLSEVHPFVMANALKGVEPEFREQLYSQIDPWLAKKIRIEWDSLGPISLAEMEEAQKGILDLLRDAIDEGKVKLWRMK